MASHASAVLTMVSRLSKSGVQPSVVEKNMISNSAHQKMGIEYPTIRTTPVSEDGEGAGGSAGAGADRGPGGS